jgi:hypothetical protein
LPLCPLKILAYREVDIANVWQEIVEQIDQDGCSGLVDRRYDGESCISVEIYFLASGMKEVQAIEYGR